MPLILSRILFMDNGQVTKSTSFYIKRSLGFCLLLALSATFFYSAYTKSGIQFLHFKLLANDNAFDSFQWTFLDLGINSITAAGIIARLMIGFELLLGLFLLFHIFLKRFTYNAVILVLSVFIIYLLVVIFRQGNTGNCGCFGDKLQMTPMQAIWKNLAMIAVTVILKEIYTVNPYIKQNQTMVLYVIICLLLLALAWFIPFPVKPVVKNIAIVAFFLIFTFIFIAAVIKKKENIELLSTVSLCLLLLTAFASPFVINPIFVGTSPQVWNKAVNLDPLYKYTPAPAIDLRKGKHIVAFMSLTCPHCKKAAYLLHVIHRDHPDIPMYIILDGPDTYQKQFFDETHAEDVPNLYYRHSTDFLAMAGTSVPSILWINNGVAEYKSVYAYYQLDPKFMEQWLRK